MLRFRGVRLGSMLSLPPDTGGPGRHQRRWLRGVWAQQQPECLAHKDAAIQRRATMLEPHVAPGGSIVALSIGRKSIITVLFLVGVVTTTLERIRRKCPAITGTVGGGAAAAAAETIPDPEETRKGQLFSAANGFRHHGPRWNWGYNFTTGRWTNWSHLIYEHPLSTMFPRSKEEVVELLRRANENKTKVKFVGASASPNAMAASSSQMVFTENLKKVLWVNEKEGLIRVESGILLSELNKVLKHHGLAMPQLPSVSFVSVGGVLATAAHGTGAEVPCISDFVESFELITADGTVMECNRSENADVFKAGLCNLGGLGFVSEVTIKVETEFKLRTVQTLERLDDVLSRLAEIVTCHQHTRFWWIPQTGNVLLWNCDTCPFTLPEKHSVDRVQNLFFKLLYEPLLFLGNRWPSISRFTNGYLLPKLHATRVERVAHNYDVLNFDCLYRQHVDEWILPAAQLPRALRRLAKLIQRHEHWSVHFPVEVRFQKSDDIWLSPAYKSPPGESHCQNNGLSTEVQETLASGVSPQGGHVLSDIFCCIGIIIYRPFGCDPPEWYRDYFDKFEKIVFDLGGRPHWAKDHRLDYRYFQQLYPKFNDWVLLRDKLDPNRIFVNKWLESILQPNFEGDFRKCRAADRKAIWYQQHAG